MIPIGYQGQFNFPLFPGPLGRFVGRCRSDGIRLEQRRCFRRRETVGGSCRQEIILCVGILPQVDPYLPGRHTILREDQHQLRLSL